MMNYAKIILFDVANGLGIRTSLFISGCKFHCEGCFNEKAQEFNYGKLFTAEEEKLILDRLERDEYSGLSLIGGDPMWQDIEGLKQLAELCTKVHALGKNVWLWTGFTYEEIYNPETTDECTFMRKVLADNVDIMIDGKFDLSKKDLTLAWRGSSNQRVINMKATKENKEIILYTDK